MQSLFDPIFTSDQLLSLTSGEAFVAAMLSFEAALAGACAEVGLVSEASAEAIAGACQRLRPDPAELGRAARATGNPVVPLVKLIGQAAGHEAAGAVHLGATSQDVLDTAVMLVARQAGSVVLDSLLRAADGAAEIASRHATTLLAGRTLLQQAVPTSLALKAAGWCNALDEAAEGLELVLSTRLAVQLGGAVGTLAPLGDKGSAVVSSLARRLSLPVPDCAWHTDRTRIAQLASALGICAGAAGKVALDVVLLAQDEVGEAGEAVVEGRGASSTMPHKRNPVASLTALAAAKRAQLLAGGMLPLMLQEHERAAGAWHAEWQTLEELLRAAGGACEQVASVLSDLRVDPSRMADNLARTNGLLLSERAVSELATRLDPPTAKATVARAVSRAVSTGTSLADQLLAEPSVADSFSPAHIATIFDPSGYLGSTRSFVAAVLDHHRARRNGQTGPSQTGPSQSGQPRR